MIPRRRTPSAAQVHPHVLTAATDCDMKHEKKKIENTPSGEKNSNSRRVFVLAEIQRFQRFGIWALRHFVGVCQKTHNTVAHSVENVTLEM